MILRAGYLASVSAVALTSAALANPQGGVVTTGAANLTMPAASNLLVTQSTGTAIINWQSFSIGAGERTGFVVPQGGATLNRVTGGDVSSIYGSLSSNGRLFLVNPNGIVVGPSGTIDTAGLVLSTRDLSDAEFLAGRDMNFAGTSRGSIVNQGTIRSTGGGDVFLIARDVQNQGTISAPGGTVGLAGGTDVLIRASDSGDGRVMVRAGSGRVVNSGQIAATVAELRAAGGNHYALAVNNTGVVRATGVVNRDGRVFLSAGRGRIASSGTLAARNVNGSGGAVRVSVASSTLPAGVAKPKPAIDITGQIDVSSPTGAGGRVVLEAPSINLGATAVVDASGATAGGQIAIGGGFHGADSTIVNALDVTVAAGARLLADATSQGDGGLVSVWSEGTTQFAGAISAQALGGSGNGGAAEVSGAHLTYNGSANLLAAHGATGTLLLDPGQVNILHEAAGTTANTADTFYDDTLASALTTANVTVQTSAASTANGSTQDIVIGSGVSIRWNAATMLSLQAGHDITALDGVTIQNTQTGDGVTTHVVKNAGGIEMLAGNDIKIGSTTATGAVAIGSEFGVTRLVAGDANFNGLPDVAGTGKIVLTGSTAAGASVQIGYIQPGLRGNNTGADYASAGVHAGNGDITLLAGGDITLTGGIAGAYVQVGHGGTAPAASIAEIASSTIDVISSGGAVKLDSVGFETGYAQIGHGSYFALAGGSNPIQGNISGDIHVDAKTLVALNDSTPSPTHADGNADIFVARIGSGAHVSTTGNAETVTTNAVSGAIRIGAISGEILTPVTPLANVTLGNAISPALTDDARQIFSQIGHGATVRLAPTSGGTVTAALGPVVSFVNIANGQPGTDITVTADAVSLISNIASPLNLQTNIERGQIGSGNYVRLENSALTTATAQNVVVSEGDLTGNVSVTTTAANGAGITLQSLVTVADKAVDSNVALTRIGHGGYVQLLTANGADAVAGGAPAASGGSITYTEANVLYSAILVQTNKADDISLTASVTSGTAAATNDLLAATIGSGTDIVLRTGNGGAGAGVANTSATGGASGGDITFHRGTVWDGAYPSASPSTGDDGYDTTITVRSARNLVMATSVTAGLATAQGDTVLGRIGHGSLVLMATGNGGAGGTLGSDGGRGGDIHVDQQTPSRDYGITGAADDYAWGLRGQITLGASDNGATAVSITSAITAATAAAADNSSSARVGHGDYIVASSGNGGAGAARGTDSFVTTAAGGRGGHVDIDLSKTLIESLIVSAGGGIVGGGLVDAQTTNATAASQHNLSESGIGHGEETAATSGGGGAGGSGRYLTNGVTVQDGQAIADTFLVSQGSVGAARGGNGGDVRILFGTITDRRGVVGGFTHDGNADVNLTIIGGNASKRSLTINAAVNAGAANGPGDDVSAVIGNASRIVALGGAGGNGGHGSSTMDEGFVQTASLAASPIEIQNDASGGRGGDIQVVLGNHADGSFAANTPANTLTIGQTIVTADEQVAVLSTAGPGSDSRVAANIGPMTDVVTLTQNGGNGGSLIGTGGIAGTSGANDGILDNSAGATIQIIVNRDGTKSVSLSGSGQADSIQSVAARRTGAPGSSTYPIFFDVDGNPEYILNGSGALVSNTGTNTAAFASLASNIARFGRTVGGYNPGVVNLERVQYIDLNNDGKPDVLAANLNSTASMLSVVDVDNNNVYDQIAGRTRLADGNLGTYGLLDYTNATGKAPAFVNNAQGWSLADFSTSNGGRGGNSSIDRGAVSTYGSAALVTVNAGVVNSGAPSSDAGFDLVVSATAQATTPSAGPNNQAFARIGGADYLYADSDRSYASRISGAPFQNGRGSAATGGNGGANAINASGGNAGNASIRARAFVGDILVDNAAANTRGVKVHAFTDDVTTKNIAMAAIGDGGFMAANAAVAGSSGTSAATTSTITEIANGGMGGNGAVVTDGITGTISVLAGSNPVVGDFSLVVEAIKGGSTSVSDSQDTTLANIGHGGIVQALGGTGGNGDQGQYQASGGNGGNAAISLGAVTGAIVLDAFTYANAANGNGIRIEASTSEGDTQTVRAQAGDYVLAYAAAGAGGGGTTSSLIVEQLNQIANGGAGGAASIAQATVNGDITLDAGSVTSGTDAIVIKSSDNTVNSGANNLLLAAVGHGGRAIAVGGAGGASGQKGTDGLSFGVDPAFYEGFDIAATSAAATAPLDRNGIQLGTIRNGGVGGAASVTLGDTVSAIVARAHDVGAAGFDGISITSLVGDGANTGSALFGNVAIIGHTGFAGAQGGAGGSSISSTLGATVTSGNGGDGGAGSVVFGAVTGATTVTNVSGNAADKSGTTKDTDIVIKAANQDATDSAAHRATAQIGARLAGEAFGGAGGSAAEPPPGPLYTASLSAAGGFGGAANVTTGAINGAIAVTAENSIILLADGGTVSSPTLVAQIGHHAIVQNVVGGAGGYGGAEGSFNDAAMLTALRRYVDLGSDTGQLSSLERQLVAPVLHYFGGSLPASFVSRILAGGSAWSINSGIVTLALARDDNHVSGTNNFVPTVSAAENDTLTALSMASGRGGNATATQGGIAGDIVLQANAGNLADAARGLVVKASGATNAGTQIAHIGHEQEVTAATAGKGAGMWPGQAALGITGDGGSVNVTQAAISGAVTLTAGNGTLGTSGDILVEALGATTTGYQRALIGHRQTIGNDDPRLRAAAVLKAGNAGMDQNVLAAGYLGNGGSVSVNQGAIGGAISLAALGTSPSGTAITVMSSLSTGSGEALATVGQVQLIDSIKAGDAVPFTTIDARQSLYGVAEGNGGSVSIQQGDLTADILLDANGKLLIEAVTATASGRALTIIGNEQDIADTRYGTRGGFVTAGQGANVLGEEDVDVANGAPGYTDTIAATPVSDGDGGNVLIAQGVLGGNIVLQSRTDNTDVLANGNTGTSDIYLGQLRYVTATSGEGGAQAGTQPRGPGDGGAVVLSRGAVSGDLTVQTLAAGKTTTVKTTSALGSQADIYAGQTVVFHITSGRSGYGEDVFASLNTALGTFVGQPAPSSPGSSTEATLRDAASAIHTMENVVAALTFANRYTAHYSAAQQASLVQALANATTALANARTAYASATLGDFARVTGVQSAASAAQAALTLAHTTVAAGGNAQGIASGADGGAIVYTAANPITGATTANEGLVSGNITIQAAPPATGSIYGVGTVAIQAEGGDGAASFVGIGHRNLMVNTSGVGGGLTSGSSIDGGVAGDGGAIVASQTTTGNVSLIANRVVVNPTSGVGPADIHLLHEVTLVDNAGRSDIEGLLGQGGAITAAQTTTGTVSIRANELSSAPTGAADGTLMADGAAGASHLRIGVEATATDNSDSDPTIGGTGGADNNRGGTIAATQAVTSGFDLNLDLNGTGHKADAIVVAVGLADKSVRIGALVSQTARSGNPVDDGSDVTVSQTVAGNTTTTGLEDLVVENDGPGATSVIIGHNATQVADSGETNGLSARHGGMTTATESVSGSISLTSSRSFTQQTDATSTGQNVIGDTGTQTARSANQRTGLTSADYPLVPGAAGSPKSNFNVVSNQSVVADLAVTSGEILIQSLNGLNGGTIGGVHLGNTANIIVDTDTDGRASSTSVVGGNLGLTTIAAAANTDATVVAPAVNGDIRVIVPSLTGAVAVGEVSTSTVSHDPAGGQPTGTFVTAQNIGSTANSAAQAINVTALRNVEVTNGAGGDARIGDYIAETSPLKTTAAVKTSSGDPSTVAQTVSQDVNVTAGNSLVMATTGGSAQIGHFSPGGNQWQVTAGRVVTPQVLGGNITVNVGLHPGAIVSGEAPAVGALGTNNALLDGTAGGTVRIGHQFAPSTGAAANVTETASGDILLDVGAHLAVKTANVGNGPYDFASIATSTTNAINGAGSVRNRIAGRTAIGAGQNKTDAQDATTEKDIMVLNAANLNSGYADNGGQLRFFMPSRQNLTTVLPVQMNDSTSQTEGLPARTATDDFIVSTAGTNHENGFRPISQTQPYTQIGTGNYAFYFGPVVTASAADMLPTIYPWDEPQRFGRFQTPCLSGVGGGVNAGGASGGIRAFAWASSYANGPSTAGNGSSCATGQVAGSDAAGPSSPWSPPQSAAPAPAVYPQRIGSLSNTVIVEAPSAPLIVLTAAPSAQTSSAGNVAPVLAATSRDAAPARVPVTYAKPAEFKFGSRVLSFALAGPNLLGAR